MFRAMIDRSRAFDYEPYSAEKVFVAQVRSFSIHHFCNRKKNPPKMFSVEDHENFVRNAILFSWNCALRDAVVLFLGSG
jgi:hypothetical protein